MKVVLPEGLMVLYVICMRSSRSIMSSICDPPTLHDDRSQIIAQLSPLNLPVFHDLVARIALYVCMRGQEFTMHSDHKIHQIW